MLDCRSPLAAVFLFLLVGSASAQVLLIDPGPAASYTAFGTGTVPFAVSSSSIWNVGSGGTYGGGATPQYADASSATGVSILSDSLENITVGAQYNFASPATNSTSNGGIGGVFATNPVNTGIYGPTASNVARGGVGMRVTGLPAGSYDVYLVAAYVGTNAPTWPQGGTPARQNVWVYSDPTVSTVTTASLGTANELLENSTKASWVSGNNYFKTTVTIDATDPTLYLFAEGALNDSLRGWMDAVEIVAVPEPGALGLLMTGLLSLGCIRRRHGGFVASGL